MAHKGIGISFDKLAELIGLPPGEVIASVEAFQSQRALCVITFALGPETASEGAEIPIERWFTVGPPPDGGPVSPS